MGAIFREEMNLMAGLPDALARGDQERFSELCYGAVVPHDDEGEASLPLADPFFEFLIATARSTVFLEWPEADSLYVIFHYDWERLTVEHKRRLLATIRETFPRLKSRQSAFDIRELLVKKFSPAEACCVFEELVHIDLLIQRRNVQWGCESILESGPGPDIYRRCKNCLTILTHDVDENIREGSIEFLESLGRVEADRAARGLPEPTG